MASSPPGSPSGVPPRPVSAMMRPPRTNSRMGTTSKAGGVAGGSRASDEDGKTSVKVAVRVRPPLKSTDPGFELIPQRFQRSMVQVTSPTSLAIDSPQGRKLFVFDKVFGEDVNQEGIWDYLVESTNSFVQGYNVSMLAYGQSGAGKSYTMGTSGPAEQGDMEIMGVIPRAATALFEKLDGVRPSNNRNSMSGLRTPARYSMNTAAMLANKSTVEKNWTLKATYVEIYNEQLRDLLLPDTVPLNERGNVTIREDVKGHILLTGLHQVEINSAEDLMAALNFGSMIRQTDSTAINAKSSRSHAVFSLNLIQRKNKSTPGIEKRFSAPLESMTGGESTVIIDSKLHFVDLAGSERLKNTGAQGERAKEGISINAGLASLGKVISQLSSRQAGSHVSYRDSKLTRLLQDSLGGNAITYMIACVTPAEFHLSETLNTVQYAQRARAIQSKPRIQQVSDETDKLALIDRLKAEVAFLREQIRSTTVGGGDRRAAATMERPERSNEREVELQNQLLDTQENYTALSQRHAKLISELARARDGELADNQAHEETLGDSATERLKRSNSFAEAVEQVVLEYEKTIQSLEQSLSLTRSSLSNTETILLEKETKCAFTESINQQLQARLKKMIDRESSTEHYLHDLETKLDGHTSGEEKNSAIVIELRKEIARVRENEAACEDYISTLEERLAEADQDTELMQREIDRLEHVVERQRSLGKLDNLLYELDHIQQDGTTNTDIPVVNGRRSVVDHSRQQSLASRRSHKDVILETEDEDEGSTRSDNARRTESEGPIDNGEPIEGEDDTQKQLMIAKNDYLPPSPAQSKFVEDKLENVTQELFDLKVEHESTVTEFDLLAAKYEEALRTLAELQDAVDIARYPARGHRDSVLSVTTPTTTRPVSFFADARVNELKDGGHYSSSRSLSSELSLAGESPSTVETSDAETAIKRSVSGDAARSEPSDETIAVEVENLRKLAAEKEQAQKLLTEKYIQLEEQHMDTLDLVEELKTEVSKAKMNESSSPRSTTPIIRRKSSQNVMMVDKAHRAFASLRNIATENFETNPDVMQNFELNLNAAMHELHSRSERVQELEADITAVRKEMETKMTIISGLTRERSSMKSTPMDMSVVSTMRDQLMQSESQMRMLHEAHSHRERELQAELEGLRITIGGHAESLSGAQRALSEHGDLRETQDKKIAELESELASWEEKHQTALTSMQASEKNLLANISELEQQILTNNEESTPLDTSSQDNIISDLRKDINEHRATVAANTTRFAQLEQSHASTREQLDEVTKSRDVTVAEIGGHDALIARFERQIAEHENVVKAHHDELNLLQGNHAKALAELRTSTQADHESSLVEVNSEHQESTRVLQNELTEARDNLTKIATQIAFAVGVDVSTEKLQDRISDLIEDQKSLSQERKKSGEMQNHMSELSNINEIVMKELETVKAELAGLVLQTSEGAKLMDEQVSVTEQLAALKKEMSDLETKNKKNSRLVEELEDQLATNYDQHQMANNRLSTLQTERNAQVDEANAAHARLQAELDAIREEYATLQAKLDDVQQLESGAKRSNSTTSQLRKSASVASLPSPPPAIPLPPLPGSINSPVMSPQHAAQIPVPPTPTNPSFNRPTSKDIAIAQIQEDQEARIRTIEKHLFAEKQLTTTLEEALTDLERQSNKVKADCDAWRRRAGDLEKELKESQEREKNSGAEKENRWSMLQVEEERKKRRDAEVARAHLEERMNAISKKKKKGSLNCF